MVVLRLPPFLFLFLAAVMAIGGSILAGQPTTTIWRVPRRGLAVLRMFLGSLLAEALGLDLGRSEELVTVSPERCHGRLLGSRGSRKIGLLATARSTT